MGSNPVGGTLLTLNFKIVSGATQYEKEAMYEAKMAERKAIEGIVEESDTLISTSPFVKFKLATNKNVLLEKREDGLYYPIGVERIKQNDIEPHGKDVIEHYFPNRNRSFTRGFTKIEVYASSMVTAMDSYML